MIIFYILVFLLVAVLAAFIYLNKYGYFQVDFQTDTSGTSSSAIQPFFAPNADYFDLYHSWRVLTEGESQEGQICYNNVNCASGLKCYENPSTGQKACYANTSNSGGFTQEATNNVDGYGEELIFTSICAQRKEVGTTVPQSYYPNYHDPVLITENLSNEAPNDCSTYSYYQTPTSDVNIACYDVDQLTGTRIVEVCQAAPNSNNICINDEGDRVYAPAMNDLTVLPSNTLCEDNTSINYLTFNFSKVPQTFETLVEGNPSFDANQEFCLSVDAVDYYPDFSIEYQNKEKTLVFHGTWGYVYRMNFGDTLPTKIDETSNLSSFTYVDSSFNPRNDSETVINRLKLDNSNGITYNFPTVNFTSNTSASTTDGNFTINSVSYNFGDTIEQINSNSVISLKPCAIFDTSYNNSYISDYYKANSNAAVLGFDGEFFDTQRFKVSRYSTKQGLQVPDPRGIISSVVYRALNYENGGMYLDYYVPYRETKTEYKSPYYMGDSVTEGLVLRKVRSTTILDSRIWLLMPPMSLSPKTLPGASNQWCNYCKDYSDDGGNNFNGNKGVIVPMYSSNISPGTEIIDPQYLGIAKQPNNKVFKKTMDALTYTGEIVGAAALGGLALGAVIYQLAKQKPMDFHLQNTDPSFFKCAQLCVTDYTDLPPPTKAVALNSGQLGGPPPGFNRGISQDFTQGDVVFGYTVGGVTCSNYRLYNPDSTNSPPISSYGVNDIFKSGNVDFIIKSSYDNTYMFDKDYFNTSIEFTVSNITVQGSGYNLGKQPANVFTHLTISQQQQFVTSVPQSSDTLPSGDCSLSNFNFTNSNVSAISECILSTNIPYSNLCSNITTSDNFYGIVPEIVKNLNSNVYTWVSEIDDGDQKITGQGMRPIFDSPVCGNNNTGSQPFYSILSIVPQFLLDCEKDQITDNEIILTTDQFNTIKNTSMSITSNATATLKTDSGDTIYDVNSKAPMVEPVFGDFDSELRIYSKDTPPVFIGTIDIETTNGVPSSNPSNYNIISLNTSNISTTAEYEIQEWWTLPINLTGTPMSLSYHNSNASNCTIQFTNKVKYWSPLERAPVDLLKNSNSPVGFASEDYPIDLSNDGLLPLGDSPQQMVYGGTFEDIREECATFTTANVCNGLRLCKWVESSNICVGKTLIEGVTEEFGDVLTQSANFSPEFFNQKPEGSKYTDITFLKSLQIEELNYQEYAPPSGTKPETIGFVPPEYVNNKNQGIENFGSSTPTLKLGRFIPYSYFYPAEFQQSTNFSFTTGVTSSNVFVKNGSQLKYATTLEKVGTNVNNFYLNLNYTQFIPYGKKSVYEVGFDTNDTVPTF